MTKAEAVAKLLAWCKAQVGYHEGQNNYNKYANDVRLQKLYGWKAQNQPWCDLFTDEAFIECFGLEDGAAMTYQPIGKGSAACRYSAQFFKDNNAFTQQPEAGDVVFFSIDGTINHQGIVEKVQGGVVYTIEGNKSDGVGQGAYGLGSGYIAGFGRPKWSVVAAENADGGITGGTNEVIVTESEVGIEGLPTLRRGMAGEVVRAAQFLLNGRGASCGVYGADGDFGPATEAAVLAFQRRNGLEADGVVGPLTWAKLLGVN